MAYRILQIFAITLFCFCGVEANEISDSKANTISDKEARDGWRLLWDGKTLDGWVGVKNKFLKPPTKGWLIKDGVLTVLPIAKISSDGRWQLLPKDERIGGGGDIVTKEKFKDFIFKFDFKLTRAANSGIKYFYNENIDDATCVEYQILHPAHPDAEKGVSGNRKSASLYDIFPANADKFLKISDEWNTGMIVSKGGKIEHWLNGEKVLEYDRVSQAYREGVEKSKYAKLGKGDDGSAQPWGISPIGRILIQDHTDSTVSFRNLKIKVLSDK